MDQKIPFSSYDFWGYLAAGFMLLFAVDQAANTKLLMRDSWTAVQGVVAVSLAYTVGHLVSSASSAVFERLLVGKLLGYPRNVLFEQPKAAPWVRKMLPGYFEPLPPETRRAVIEKGGKVGVNTPGEALFWPAHAAGRATPAVAARMETFINLYGFCRNIAFVALIDAAVLYWSYLKPDGPDVHLLWARLALVAAVGMTLRYLKFFRHFALEVFTSWAYSKDKEA